MQKFRKKTPPINCAHTQTNAATIRFISLGQLTTSVTVLPFTNWSDIFKEWKWKFKQYLHSCRNTYTVHVYLAQRWRKKQLNTQTRNSIIIIMHRIRATSRRRKCEWKIDVKRTKKRTTVHEYCRNWWVAHRTQAHHLHGNLSTEQKHQCMYGKYYGAIYVI